jgi:hypothetical protein
VCRDFLHRWRNCLLAAVATLICSRCAEAGALQSCYLWVDFDLEAGYRRWGESRCQCQDPQERPVQTGASAAPGRPSGPPAPRCQAAPRLHVRRRQRPSSGVHQAGRTAVPMPCLPAAFSPLGGPGPVLRAFELSRLPTAGEASAMVVRALGHVGYNTALFSGISARRGGLSTAIEAGVPEAILWMQSGHAQDVAARRWRLGFPAVQPQASLPHVGGAQALGVVHFQCCEGWRSGSAHRPARAQPRPSPGQPGDVQGFF